MRLNNVNVLCNVNYNAHTHTCKDPPIMCVQTVASTKYSI